MKCLAITRWSAISKALAWCYRTIGFEEGLIIRSTQGRMIMAPALVAGRTQLDELVEKTKRAVDRTDGVLQGSCRVSRFFMQPFSVPVAPSRGSV